MTTISERIIPSAVAASLAATMMLAGCSAAQPNADADASAPQTEAPAASQAGAVTFTDDTGAEVTVDNPQRVVACMGSFASIWELAGGTLVGASDDAFTLSDYDLKSENVQKVGDFSNPNLESIIALEPDFVIMTSGSGGRGGDSNQADLKAALAASNIPVACFQVTTFADYERMLRTCCDITGRDDLYEQNAQAVSERIKAITAKVPAGEAPTARDTPVVQPSRSNVGSHKAKIRIGMFGMQCFFDLVRFDSALSGNSVLVGIIGFGDRKSVV